MRGKSKTQFHFFSYASQIYIMVGISYVPNTYLLKKQKYTIILMYFSSFLYKKRGFYTVVIIIHLLT